MIRRAANNTAIANTAIVSSVMRPLRARGLRIEPRAELPRRRFSCLRGAISNERAAAIPARPTTLAQHFTEQNRRRPPGEAGCYRRFIEAIHAIIPVEPQLLRPPAHPRQPKVQAMARSIKAPRC